MRQPLRMTIPVRTARRGTAAPGGAWRAGPDASREPMSAMPLGRTGRTEAARHPPPVASRAAALLRPCAHEIKQKDTP